MRRPTSEAVGADQVDRAGRQPTPSPSGSSMSAEIHILSGLYLDDGDWADMRVAAMCIRRLCNHHQCPGSNCRSRNHRRDIAYLTHMLDILVPDLPGTIPEFTEDDYALPGTRKSRKG